MFLLLPLVFVSCFVSIFILVSLFFGVVVGDLLDDRKQVAAIVVAVVF